MMGRAVLVGLLLICVATGATTALEGMRQPSCPTMDKIVACPRNFAPVCGSDGNTYGNECTLCFQRQITNMVILVAKEGKCGNVQEAKSPPQ